MSKEPNFDGMQKTRKKMSKADIFLAFHNELLDLGS
jgi:hypothetical protein